jgi:two-component system OmpR family sensor kinase
MLPAWRGFAESMSLRRRLLATIAPLFILGLVVVNVVVYAALQSFLLQRVDDQLQSTHMTVQNFLTGDGGGGGGGGPGGRGGSLQSLPQYTYGALYSPSGSLVTQHTFVVGPDSSATGQAALATHPVLPNAPAPGTSASPHVFSVDGTGGVSRYRVFVDILGGGSGSGDIVVAAIPLDDVDSTLSRLLLLEVGVSGGVTIAVVATTWLVVRRGLRPLERMGQTARSIVATDLSKRVTPSTEKTEVGRLGLALNTMLAQLEKTFAERAAQEQRLRHFISDASHELRTPLTSMQGYAELLLRNPDMEGDDLGLAMRRMQNETSRMGVLVDDLLLLARLDQGRPLQRGRVDLEALVADACADARAADAQRRISARISAPLVVVGDDMRLRQVMGNIVRNALVHTPAGTPVEIELRAEDSLAVIEVVDHGAGIPADQVDRIFERFHRADPVRSGDQGGSGLGLSIAAAVVGAHGGRITVSQTPGGGATFRIELPVTADVEQVETPSAL